MVPTILRWSWHLLFPADIYTPAAVCVIVGCHASSRQDGPFSQRQRSRNNLITFTSHVDEFWMFRQALRRSFQMKCGFRVTTNLLLSLWERWFNVLFGSGGSFPKFKGCAGKRIGLSDIFFYWVKSVQTLSGKSGRMQARIVKCWTS